MIIPIEEEKVSGKIQNPFKIKALNHVGIEETYFRIINLYPTLY
jgi:hypothetical protein